MPIDELVECLGIALYCLVYIYIIRNHISNLPCGSVKVDFILDVPPRRTSPPRYGVTFSRPRIQRLLTDNFLIWTTTINTRLPSLKNGMLSVLLYRNQFSFKFFYFLSFLRVEKGTTNQLSVLSLVFWRTPRMTVSSKQKCQTSHASQTKAKRLALFVSNSVS